jgi:hypothetical protein
MCTFKDQITDKKVVKGYKVAIQDKYNHYYSPVTGMRYKAGKIGKIKGYGKHSVLKLIQFRDILDPDDWCHVGNYSKKTAIFKHMKNAKAFKHLLTERYYSRVFNTEPNPFVIVEMALTGDLYDGKYSGNGAYIGSEIVSIKKVKE